MLVDNYTRRLVISMSLSQLADAFHDKIQELPATLEKTGDFVYVFENVNIIFLLVIKSLAIILIHPHHTGHIKEYTLLEFA